MFNGIRSIHFDESGDLGFGFKERCTRGTTTRPLPENYNESCAKKAYVPISTEEYLKNWQHEKDGKVTSNLGKRKASRSTTSKNATSQNTKHDNDASKKSKFTSKETCPTDSDSDDDKSKRQSKELGKKRSKKQDVPATPRISENSEH